MVERMHTEMAVFCQPFSYSALSYVIHLSANLICALGNEIQYLQKGDIPEILIRTVSLAIAANVEEATNN